MSNLETAHAMYDHHASMTRQLNALVGKLDPFSPTWVLARDEVSEYVCQELIPHAEAEETTVYHVAASLESLSKLIESMRYEHTEIQRLTRSLQVARTPDEGLMLAGQIAILFEVHAEKENRFVIDVLALQPDVDLPAVLGDMHQMLAR